MKDHPRTYLQGFLRRINEVCYHAMLVTEVLLVAICEGSKIGRQGVHPVLWVMAGGFEIISKIDIFRSVFTGPARDLKHAFIFSLVMMDRPITRTHFTWGVSLVVHKAVDKHILVMPIILRINSFSDY